MILDLPEHLPAVDVRHHHVEEHEVRLCLRNRSQPFVRAACLTHRVALELEIHPHELADLVVVVDEQDERARLRAPARSRTVEERLQVGAPVATVTARGVEGRHPALIRPFANRALGNPEETGRLPEREPLAVVALRHP